MNKKEAFKKCRKLNPPLYPIQPMPYGVRQAGKEFEVVDLRTKEVVAK